MPNALITFTDYMDDSELPVLHRFDAHVGDQNVGYLTTHPATDGGIWFKGLKVKEQFRRLGIARRLLERAIQYNAGQEISLRALPYDGSPVTSEELQNFYQKFGFQTYDNQQRMRRPAT